MTIIRMLRQSLFPAPVQESLARLPSPEMPNPRITLDTGGFFEAKKVLNVGGNNKEIPIPDHYDGWTHHLLDIDSRGKPDILCDARKLIELAGASYDSVYCSHNLEHYHSHDVIKVLNGFHHILKADGFVDIRVPDIQAVVKHMVEKSMDIEDVLYQAVGGPVSIKDVMYGWGKEIEESGEDFFGHKTGFSEKSLIAVLYRCRFTAAYVLTGSFELKVFAFKQAPDEALLAKLNLPESMAASLLPATAL